MNDPNHKISARQLRALLLFTATTDIVTISALGMGGQTRETVFAYLVSAALLTLAAYTARNFAGRARLCRSLRCLLCAAGILLLAVWAGLCFFTLHDYLSFLYGKFSDTTLILLLLAAGAAYGVYSGIEGVARLSALFFWLSMLLLAAALIKTAPLLSLRNLVAGYGALNPRAAAALTLSQLLSAESVLFWALGDKVRAEDSVAQSFMEFVWLRAALFGGVFVLLKALLGHFLQAGRFPLFAALISKNGSASDILSLLIVFVDLCALAVKLCAAAYGILALARRVRQERGGETCA